MDFLSLPDDIILDMMVHKFSLAEISNFIKVNRRMRSLFLEIRENSDLYREYIDAHFDRVREEFIVISEWDFSTFIFFPYEQKIYKQNDRAEDFYRFKISNYNIIFMVYKTKDEFIILNDLGELYIFNGKQFTRINKNEYFIRLLNKSVAINEDSELIFLDSHSNNIKLDDPLNVFDVEVTRKDFTEIAIIMNDGTVYDRDYRYDSMKEKIRKYLPPSFIIKGKLLSKEDPSSLYSIYAMLYKETLSFNVINVGNFGRSVLLVDTNMNIYEYTSMNIKSLKLILDGKNISGQIKISYICGLGSTIYILDKNRIIYQCTKRSFGDDVMYVKLVSLHETEAPNDH